VVGPFDLLEQLRNGVVAQSRRKSHLAGRHHKPLPRLRFLLAINPCLSNRFTVPLNVSPLRRTSSSTSFRNIIVDGKSRSHIMMLAFEAS